MPGFAPSTWSTTTGRPSIQNPAASRSSEPAPMRSAPETSGSHSPTRWCRPWPARRRGVPCVPDHHQRPAASALSMARACGGHGRSPGPPMTCVCPGHCGGTRTTAIQSNRRRRGFQPHPVATRWGRLKSALARIHLVGSGVEREAPPEAGWRRHGESPATGQHRSVPDS
jgi:hypothetical protein